MFARLARYGLLAGIFLSFLLFWLPFMRGPLDGVTYEWGRAMFGHMLSGAGTGGDYWFPVAGVGLGLLMLFLGWRSPGAGFKALSTAWAAVMLADAVYTRFVLGETLEFHGDTMGVAIDLTLVFIGAYAAMVAFALVWAFGGKSGRTPRWGLTNSLLLGLAAVLVPAQYLLLSTGEGRELSDQFGVLITMGQWLLLGVAFAPWHRGRLEQGALQPA